MLVLAADTSTNAGSLALVMASATDAAAPIRVLVERSWDLAGSGVRRPGAPNHSDRIVPEIEEMLRASGVEYGDLAGLACATGPGSFTGLRVALSALKGIALARNLPLAGVSTLEALAWNLPFANRRLVPMLDARKSEVYAGVFESAAGTVTRLRPDEVTPPDPFLASLAAADAGADADAAADAAPVVLLGDGAAVYAELVAKHLAGRVAFADGSSSLPRAGNVARLALPALRRGRTPETEPAAIVPTYLRRPEAEFKRLGEQPKPT